MPDPNETRYPSSPDETTYRRIVQAAPAALIATDRHLSIHTVNQAARDILRIPRGELKGTSLPNLLPDKHRRGVERLARRVLQGDTQPHFEIELPVPDGESRYLNVVMGPLEPKPDGPTEGVIFSFIDQSQIHRHTELRAQRERMHSLSTLAAGVAHHFNNILGGVGTFVDYALTSMDFVAMKRALQMTAEAVSRASEITQSLLSFSEHPTHRHDLADLTEVILTFAHLVEGPLEEKGIRFNLDLKPVPIVEVETHRMHQVLGNLLSNAEQAMPDGGKIKLSLDRTDGEVILKFSDTGTGIDPRNLPMVFEPFYTTHGLHAGGNQVNAGLGLSVVHGIVLEMGGHIGVESTPGEGTTFTIRLPDQTPDAP